MANKRIVPISNFRQGLKRHFDELKRGQSVHVSSHHKTIGVLLHPSDYWELANGGKRMSEIITLYNHTGGSAKTTLTRELAYGLAQKGYRVLAVDLDSQANLTEFLGYLVDVDIRPEHTALSAILENKPLTPIETRFGFDLIPGHEDLRRVRRADIAELLNLRKHLKKIAAERGYQYILIDASPAGETLSSIASASANKLICPIPSTIKGLRSIRSTISVVQESASINPDLEILMYVLTRAGRTSGVRYANEQITEQLDQLGVPYFNGLTERSTPFEFAAAECRPVLSLEYSNRNMSGIETTKEELVQIVSLLESLTQAPVKS